MGEGIWRSRRKGYKVTFIVYFMKKEINLFMRKLREMPDFHRVKFVILFGSQASGKANKMSDYDFAVYYDGSDKERFDFRKKILSIVPDKFDVHVLQDLPLYVQNEVLKGKVIYAKDLRFAYDHAYEIIKRFEDFKKYYYDYIGLERMK